MRQVCLKNLALRGGRDGPGTSRRRLEYLLQVPANRIGYTALSVGQLKIIQEVITLSVFVPFSVMYLKEPLKLDYLWAGLCLLAAVYFMFRDKLA